MLLTELREKKFINPPKWIDTNCCYLTIVGSMAFGVSSDSSDYDVYGFCVPPKGMVFPHLDGHVLGFGKPPKKFDQWQQHGIHDASACAGHGRTYDLTIYGIVKFFSLAMAANPTILDSIFTPATCVLHSTKISTLVRENRRLFLSKAALAPYKGYSFAQLHKIREPARDSVREFEKRYNLPSTNYLGDRLTEVKDHLAGNKRQTYLTGIDYQGESEEVFFQRYTTLLESGDATPVGKRKILVEKHGFDTKYSMHLIRLLSECEMLLTEGDIDLQRNREELKAIRRGDWTEEQVRQVASEKERRLEDLCHKSSLPLVPDESKIKALLLDCLQLQYGNLSDCVVDVDRATVALRNIRDELEKVSSLL